MALEPKEEYRAAANTNCMANSRNYQPSVFESLIDSSTDAIIIIDSEEFITYNNAAAAILFGCNANDTALRDKPYTTFWSAQNKVSLATVTNQLAADCTGWRGEVFQSRLDGSSFIADITISPFVATDGNSLFSLILRDITKYKEAESNLRYQASLQENVSDAVIACDLDFRIKSWNKAAERIYGWKEEEVLGKNTRDVLKSQFISGQSRVEVDEHFRSTGFWKGEIVQSRKDGTYAYILASIVIFKDEEGTPQGIVGINQDISDHYRAKEQFQRALDKEKELGELRTHFVTTASHEFRTPLSSILSSAELLERYSGNLSDEKKLKHLQRIQNSAKVMSRLLNDIFILGKKEDTNP
jgi:PAS domain S-box-containing protein